MALGKWVQILPHRGTNCQWNWISWSRDDFPFWNFVKGLTTAASLWAICGVGIAIGVGLYFAALLSVLFIMAVLALLELFEQRLRTRGVHLIQVLISDIP